MAPLPLLIHLLSFLAPALALAALLTVAGRLLLRRQRPLFPWWGQLALNAMVGTAILGLGLWQFGVDGKMATYAALVAGVAAAQWVGGAGWRA